MPAPSVAVLAAQSTLLSVAATISCLTCKFRRDFYLRYREVFSTTVQLVFVWTILLLGEGTRWQACKQPTSLLPTITSGASLATPCAATNGRRNLYEGHRDSAMHVLTVLMVMNNAFWCPILILSARLLFIWSAATVPLLAVQMVRAAVTSSLLSGETFLGSESS